MSYYQEFEQELIRLMSTRAWKVMPIVQLVIGLIGFKGLMMAPTVNPILPMIPYSVIIVVFDLGAAGAWFLIGRPSWYAPGEGKVWKGYWVVMTTYLILVGILALLLNLAGVFALLFGMPPTR